MSTKYFFYLKNISKPHNSSHKQIRNMFNYYDGLLVSNREPAKVFDDILKKIQRINQLHPNKHHLAGKVTIFVSEDAGEFIIDGFIHLICRKVNKIKDYAHV